MNPQEMQTSLAPGESRGDSLDSLCSFCSLHSLSTRWVATRRTADLEQPEACLEGSLHQNLTVR